MVHLQQKRLQMFVQHHIEAQDMEAVIICQVIRLTQSVKVVQHRLPHK